jgi:DNA polymerase-3 subunit epsilon
MRSEHAAWHEGERLGFDLETTGIDPFSDVPVSYALVWMVGDERVRTLSQIVNPGRPIPPEASDVHGITDEMAARGCGLEDALRVIVDALLDASRRNVPIVGMNVCFDLTMTDTLSTQHYGRSLVELGFDAPVVDARVLDLHLDRWRKGKRSLTHLCETYAVAQSAAHEAVGDVESTHGVVAAIVEKFPEITGIAAADLTAVQARWHREWCHDFSDYLVGEGLDPLPGWQYHWPFGVAGADAPEAPVVLQGICQAVDCSSKVPTRFFMCAKHWRMLPSCHRSIMWRFYNRNFHMAARPPRAYLEAVHAAVKALDELEHPGDLVETEDGIHRQLTFAFAA